MIRFEQFAARSSKFVRKRFDPPFGYRSFDREGWIIIIDIDYPLGYLRDIYV